MPLTLVSVIQDIILIQVILVLYVKLLALLAADLQLVNALPVIVLLLHLDKHLLVTPLLSLVNASLGTLKIP